MSTYDVKARGEQMDRELEEYVQAMRLEDKENMSRFWVLLGFGMFCLSLGFLFGRSL